MTQSIKLASSAALKSLLLIFLLAYMPSSATADDSLVPLLRFPEMLQTAGEPIKIRVYYHNESEETQQLTLPEDLLLRMQFEQGSVSFLTATAEESEAVTIDAGEFLFKEYSLEFPTGTLGIVEVMIADQPSSTVLISLHEPDNPDDPGKNIVASESDIKDEHLPSNESLFSLYQNYMAKLSPYKPMYFLVGADPQDSSFQISLKYRPFNPAGSLAKYLTWLQRVHFAYTQTSFWDLDSDSAPFQDTSYKPELFYLSQNIAFRPQWMSGMFLQTGVLHESNGRGGDSSRSTNSVYIQPSFVFFDEDTELGLLISPNFSAYFNNNDKTNPDLADYRGHVGLDLKFGQAKGAVAGVSLRFAERGTSVQADLTYPISKLLGNNLDIYLHLQYVDTIAESLLDYTERNRAFRLGFALVR